MILNLRRIVRRLETPFQFRESVEADVDGARRVYVFLDSPCIKVARNLICGNRQLPRGRAGSELRAVREHEFIRQFYDYLFAVFALGRAVPCAREIVMLAKVGVERDLGSIVVNRRDQEIIRIDEFIDPNRGHALIGDRIPCQRDVIDFGRGRSGCRRG